MSRIEDLMSRPVHTCKHDDTLNAAARSMWEHDCGALPVVDAAGELVGMVTDRDICMTACLQGKSLVELPVSSAMSTVVCSCRSSDSIDAAERLMRDNKIRRVPIVDPNNRPVGVLSLDDLARDALTRKQRDVEHAFVQTMAEICKPRLAA